MDGAQVSQQADRVHDGKQAKVDQGEVAAFAPEQEQGDCGDADGEENDTRRQGGDVILQLCLREGDGVRGESR